MAGRLPSLVQVSVLRHSEGKQLKLIDSVRRGAAQRNTHSAQRGKPVRNRCAGYVSRAAGGLSLSRPLEVSRIELHNGMRLKTTLELTRTKAQVGSETAY